MLNLKNIHPLSDFLRNAKSHLARLNKTGEPTILTVNGQAQAVVLSAEAYQSLVNELETERTLNSVHQGTLEALKKGQISSDELVASMKSYEPSASVPAAEAFTQLERKFAARRRKRAS